MGMAADTAGRATEALRSVRVSVSAKTAVADPKRSRAARAVLVVIGIFFFFLLAQNAYNLRVNPSRSSEYDPGHTVRCASNPPVAEKTDLAGGDSDCGPPLRLGTVLIPSQVS